VSVNRLLALEFVRVTEAAAIESARLTGRGDKHAADQAAVDAMRRALDTVAISGTIVIGEGERDEAPMLYIGEKVGAGGPAVDIALDPLEGTNLCASGYYDSLCVIAVTEPGGFLHAPDTYMEKIAVGPECVGIIDITKSPTENLRRIAERKHKSVENLLVTVLDRERHQSLINEIRQAGARVKLISDGDLSASIATCNPTSGVDALMGTGGAPEGVLSAAALRCLGGDIQGILRWRSEDEKARARDMGVKDLNRVYSIVDLARGPVIFCVTGVTPGSFCEGVRFETKYEVTTHSVVMRSTTGTVRDIRARHHLDRKPGYI
jgi:fructose-1,6-bisphosphatase II